MRRTFNCGLGFLFVVPASDRARAVEVLTGLGEAPVAVGTVVEVPPTRPFEERVEWAT
jgi:phosphoribosylaminoimidazole (AIR) synthetase